MVVEHQGLMPVLLRPEGACLIFCQVHLAAALVIQAQHAGIALPRLAATSCKRGMAFRRQETVPVPLAHHAKGRQLRHKRLHLHVPCRHERPRKPAQVYDLIPLVHMEAAYGRRTHSPFPRLRHQGLVAAHPRPQRRRHIFGNIHPLPALVIQAEHRPWLSFCLQVPMSASIPAVQGRPCAGLPENAAALYIPGCQARCACTISASFNCGGSSLPLSPARRRIPWQAVLLK